MIQAELGVDHTFSYSDQAAFLPGDTVHSSEPMLAEAFRISRHQTLTPSYYINRVDRPQAAPSKATLDKDVDLDGTLESSEFTDSETGWQKVTEKSTEYRPKRSLILKNLPPEASLKDVIDVLRGGMILDVYIGPKENQAFVSFVEPSVAKAFLQWTHYNPIKIRGHKVRQSFAVLYSF